MYFTINNGHTWSLAQKLLAADGGGGDWFGRSVSIFMNTIIAGSWKEDTNGNNAGIIKVEASHSHSSSLM